MLLLLASILAVAYERRMLGSTSEIIYSMLKVLLQYTKHFWVISLTLTLPGPSAGVSGSLDSYCSLKPLCSGMGEVVPCEI